MTIISQEKLIKILKPAGCIDPYEVVRGKPVIYDFHARMKMSGFPHHFYVPKFSLPEAIRIIESKVALAPWTLSKKVWSLDANLFFFNEDDVVMMKLLLG